MTKYWYSVFSQLVTVMRQVRLTRQLYVRLTVKDFVHVRCMSLADAVILARITSTDFYKIIQMVCKTALVY